MNVNQTHQTPAKILIVDDSPANLNMLSDTLEPEGYNILIAASGEVALKIAARASPDLILLDVLMPGIDGFETCRRLKGEVPTADIPVLFVTAKGETKSLVQAFRTGGVDYITKPFEKEEVLARVATHLKVNQLTRALRQKNAELTAANEKLQQEIARRERSEDALLRADEQLSIISQREASRWGIAGFIGQSRTIEAILNEVHQLQGTETTSVLITGESGTGKELIARAIHFGGRRAKGPFVPLNCSAIPGELAESAIFGHTRGAFTGANTARKGYFELADGGTLFLDEIGDMPLALQAKLLRVLEDGYITPLGGTHEKHVDVRVLAATNVDLQLKIAAGTFREDLYFRLDRFTVTVPPLRERKEDIPLLATHFLKMFAAEMGIGRPGNPESRKAGKPDNGLPLTTSLSPEALEALMNYHFPGNIRELKNIIERALILSRGSEIQLEHLHFIKVSERPPTAQPTLPPQTVGHPEFIGEAQPPQDRRQIEARVLRRAQARDAGKKTASSPETDFDTYSKKVEFEEETQNYDAVKYPLRFWIWHGRNDVNVQFATSEKFVELLKGKGWEYTFKVDDSDHFGIAVGGTSSPLAESLQYFSKMLGDAPTVVQPHGKLATTWGEMKRGR